MLCYGNPVCGFLLWFGSAGGVFIRTRVGQGLSVVSGGVSLTVLPTNPPSTCMRGYEGHAGRWAWFVCQATQHINPFRKRPAIENNQRSFTKLGQCETDAQVNVWLSFEQIQILTQNEIFVLCFKIFLTPVANGQFSRTVKDFFTKLGQSATKVPGQCFW